MPRITPRQKRRNRLIRYYFAYKKTRRDLNDIRREKNRQRSAAEQRPLSQLDTEADVDSLLRDAGNDIVECLLSLPLDDLSLDSLIHDIEQSSASSSSSSSSESTDDSSSSDSASLSDSSDSTDTALDLGMDTELDGMPGLLSGSSDDEDDEDDEYDEDDEGMAISEDLEGEDEWVDEETLGSVTMSTPNFARHVAHALIDLYSSRYTQPRDEGVRVAAQLPDVLTLLKEKRPDHFRQELRVWPETFDALVQRLSSDPVFTNRSNHDQMPIEHQIAIVLYRFGHFGNAASLDKVAKWAGYAKGTVVLATRRVLTAILRPTFREDMISMPGGAEKEEAKIWVESKSCPGWRDGWLMVDGTLVPLYDRPHWYGESYFDRKQNYSLNFQVINTPNLYIVDCGYGYTGSTHDATAWEKTWVHQNHERVFEGREFIWADSAYPLETWVVAPYKKPDSNLEDNSIFNNHLSMVRIRSEHAIGFLKGRFQSLKGLRSNIIDSKAHKLATYWVVACIAVHDFAMRCEQSPLDSNGNIIDDFLTLGLQDPASNRALRPSGPPPARGSAASRAAALAAGRARREELKAMLLNFIAQRRRR